MACLKIRYKDPEAASSQLLEFPIERRDLRAQASETSDDFRFAAAGSYFGHILRESKFRGSYSVDQIISLAEAAGGADANGYRREFIELVRNFAALRR